MRTIDPLPLFVSECRIAYAIVGVAPDRDRKAVSLQVVRIGVGREVPNEGREAYLLSAEDARILQTELGQAIAALEPPPASKGTPGVEAEASADAGRASTSTDAETPATLRVKRSKSAG